MIRLIILQFIILVSLFGNAFSAQSTKTAGSGANVDYSGGGAWTDPSNVTSSSSWATNNTETTSDWIRAYTFGFTSSDVPTGATINGILVTVEKQTSTSCFSGETLINIPGGKKRIDKLKEKDIIVSFDTKTQKITTSKVVSIHKRTVDSYNIIKICCGRSVKVTDEHPFWTPNGWVKAKDLSVGSEVLVISDKFLEEKLQFTKILDIQNIQKPIDVYNLTVDGNETFFASSFGVHNKGTCMPPADREYAVNLGLGDGTSVGTNNYSSENVGDCVYGESDNCWVWSSNPGTYYYPSDGLVDDVWGDTWNSGSGGNYDITDADFGVWLRGSGVTAGTGCVETLSIRNVRITIDYTEASSRKRMFNLY